tara:strand:+ start:341 stop:583 length:243 start_codon:yes stop_codon:yes gene_type:complete
MKPRAIVIPVSILAIMLGIFIGLKANNIANIPISKIDPMELKRIEKERERSSAISDLLVFGGLFTLVSFLIVDFVRWARS